MSRKVLLSAVSVILLPVVLAFLEVQARGAPPKTPAAAAKVAVKPPAAKPLVAGERAILKALKQPVSFDFKDAPLTDVVDFLQDKHGIPIRLDKIEMEKESKAPDTPVTCKLSGISLRSALDLLLDSLELKWTIHGEVLLITTPEKAESEEFLLTKFYDVGDLIVVAAATQDRPYRGGLLWGENPIDSYTLGVNPSIGTMGGMGMGGPGGGGQMGPPQSPKSNASADHQALMDLIQQIAEPKSWDANGGCGTIAAFDQSLVVSNHRPVHEKIAALLASLRARRQATPILTVDFQWVWLAAGPYKELSGGEAAAGRGPLAIDAKLLERLAGQAAGFRGRATCRNGQLVHLVAGDRRSLVVGSIPVVGSTAVGPQDGTLLVSQPARKADKDGRSAGIAGGAAGSMPKGLFAVTPATVALGRGMGRLAQVVPAPATSPSATANPEVGYMPVVDVPNAGVIVEVRPIVAPGAGTVLLDVTSTVARWQKPSPPAQMGSCESGCAVDRPNMSAAQMAATARVPLGKPVLLGAITFAPADQAGLDEPSDNPVQLCLIATTRMAEPAPKPGRKK